MLKVCRSQPIALRFKSQKEARMPLTLAVVRMPISGKQGILSKKNKKKILFYTKKCLRRMLWLENCH